MKETSLQKQIKNWVVNGLKTKTITFEDDLVDITVCHFKKNIDNNEKIINYIIKTVNRLETKYKNFLKSL